MRRALAIVVCVAALAAACEDEIPVHDAGVPADLAYRDLLPPPDLDPDALGPLDLAQPPGMPGVVCGAGTCFAEANQYCQTTDWGQSGSCEMAPSPEPNFYACDGPEDCATGACCFLVDASVCGLFGFCVAGSTVGEFMCHTDAECGARSRCCRKGTTGTYRSCVDGLGPNDPCPIP